MSPKSSATVAAFLLFTTVSCKPSKRFALSPLHGGSDVSEWKWQEQPAPVLARGAAGSWDAVDALNPSVLRWKGQYWNFYSGYDGKTWHTGVATSGDDLQTWNQRVKVLSPDPATWEGDYIAANGSAIEYGGSLFYFYQAGRRAGPASVGLARSSDGFSWQKHPAAILEPGPRGSWDERGVADPYAIRQGEWLYVYYTGMDRAQRQRLGVARSRNGIDWEKSLDNPILDIGGHDAWDEGGLGEPAIWWNENWYWMLYTGRAWDEKRRIGMARSRDGIHWEKLPNHVFSGASAWDAAVICDPSVEPLPNGSVRVWFGGGDQPKPDEGLNGQIGLAVLLRR